MRDLADQLFDLTLDHHTLRPNLMGLRDDCELQDHSEEAEQDYLRRYRSVAEEAQRRTAETEDDRITRDLVLHLTRAECDTIESRTIEYGVSCYLQDAVPELLYFLGHLKSHHAVPRFLATVAERHRAGVEAGRTPVRHLVEQAIAFVDQYDDPAVRHYRDVLVNDVLPHGRDEEHAGLCWLPDGEALYRTAIRTHTTLDLDPHELHATGLRLIEDLKREFGGRRPSGLTYSGAEEMIGDAETAVRRAESIAPQWFRTVPRAKCEISATAPSAPASAPPHYLPAALDGSRPARTSSTPRSRTPGSGTSRRRRRFTRRCRATTSRAPGSSSWCTCHCSAARRGSPRSARAGRSTANAWPTRWASTAPKTPGSACSPRTPCARAGSSPTPACTPRAGAGSRPSTTCSRTRRCRANWSKAKSTATSPSRARHSRTWWGASSSRSCAPKPSRR